MAPRKAAQRKATDDDDAVPEEAAIVAIPAPDTHVVEEGDNVPVRVTCDACGEVGRYATKDFADEGAARHLTDVHGS